MGKNREITKSAYPTMLNWLSEDSEIAAKKYEVIRLRLVKILNYRGCLEAEELADETIERVAKKAEKIIETYQGNPESYFFGVLNNVYREYLKRRKLQELPATLVEKKPEVDEDFESNYQCLKRCLKTLPDEKREFILDYYKGEKSEKIENRKKIAEDQGINTGRTRVRAYRLRLKLQKCVFKCVKENNNETF